MKSGSVATVEERRRFVDRSNPIVSRSVRMGPRYSLHIVEIALSNSKVPDQFLVNLASVAPTVRYILKDGLLLIPPETLDLSSDLAQSVVGVCSRVPSFRD